MNLPEDFQNQENWIPSEILSHFSFNGVFFCRKLYTMYPPNRCVCSERFLLILCLWLELQKSHNDEAIYNKKNGFPYVSAFKNSGNHSIYRQRQHQQYYITRTIITTWKYRSFSMSRPSFQIITDFNYAMYILYIEL